MKFIVTSVLIFTTDIFDYRGTSKLLNMCKNRTHIQGVNTVSKKFYLDFLRVGQTSVVLHFM